MKFERMIASAVAMALATVSAGTAQAAQYMVSYTSNGTNNFSGLFTTTDVADANGFFTVTALTGTRNGLAASLLSPGTIAGNDNLFKPTSTYFDGDGIAFSAGGISYNPFYNGSVLRELIVNGPSSTALTITSFTVSNVGGAVPEPASWAMMIMGMGVVGGVMRRRAKVTSKVSFA